MSLECIIVCVVIFYIRDKAIKRKMCKVCDSLLIPGFTSRVVLREKKVSIECEACKSSKSFTSNAAPVVATHNSSASIGKTKK